MKFASIPTSFALPDKTFRERSFGKYCYQTKQNKKTCWPQSPEFYRHGISVFANDGSKYDLPATEELREEFDPHSGLQYS